MSELIALRSAFTVVSLLTFIGIMAWAWRPGSKRAASLVMADLLADDDRARGVAQGERQ